MPARPCRRCHRRRTGSRPCRGCAGRRRAERPAAVFRRRAVAGEQDAADVGRHAGVIERGVQLVDRVRPERVADLGPIERDAHDPDVVGAVIGDVGEVEPGDRRPQRRVERVGDVGTSCRHVGRSPARGRNPAARRTNRARRYAPRRAERRDDHARGRPARDRNRAPISRRDRGRSGSPTATCGGDLEDRVEGRGMHRRTRRRHAVGVRRRLGEPVGQGPRVIEVVLRESVRVVRQIGPVLITETRHGFVCANSGVDQSSSGATGRVLMLPSIRTRRRAAAAPSRRSARRGRRRHRHVRSALA